jgi:hypothetical protein
MTHSVSSLDSGLDDRGIVVPFPSVAWICFCLHESVHTSSASHLASIQWVPEDPSLEVTRPGREADHSPSSSAEVMNTWSHSSTRPFSIMASTLTILPLVLTCYILYFSKNKKNYSFIVTFILCLQPKFHMPMSVFVYLLPANWK